MSAAIRLVVGVEIHAKVRSSTKLFSRACASARDLETGRPPAPNSFVGWLDCALPGAMPRINQHCVNQAIVTGLAFGGNIQEYSLFERKHYFYCDSPAGYQITQQSFPIVLGGIVKLSNNKQVRIARIQLEQDTGKSVHSTSYTLVDFNRAGSPLMEIVSEPDLSTAAEAADYVRTVQRLLRHIGTCDGNMEDGSLRADINISVHDDNTHQRSHRVEVKNLNSLRSIERAVLYEQKRLVSYLSDQGTFNNETRTFDVKTGETVSMREKEGQVDYRFMVEPDLPPLVVRKERIEVLSKRMLELPDQARSRLAKEFGLRSAEIEILLPNPALLSFFEAIVAISKAAPPPLIATLICNNLLGALRKENLEDDPFLCVDVEDFRELADRLHLKQLSMQRAKDLILDCIAKQVKINWTNEKLANLVSSGEEESIRKACEQILDEFPSEVAKYRDGKSTLVNFFFGKAFAKLKLQQSKSIPDVQQVRQILDQVLSERCA